MLRIMLTAFFLTQAAGWSADPVLLALVMPDAKAVAGVQVAEAKTSAFGQYVLTHMQP
ncbi:MAG: hypothetical protein JO022_11470, partial [Acidobacteriaceae bacterium]|nr:hypothetical protein [Acidobacteriaceae bacterium]